MSDTVWSVEDSQRAAKSGWDLFTIWDDKKSRYEYEVQGFGEAKFDAAIKAQVKIAADKGDTLCQKAIRLAFVSKMTTPTPKPTQRSKNTRT